MNRHLATGLSALALAGLSAPVLAAHHKAEEHGSAMAKAMVTEKNNRGHATKVEIDGKVYSVCTPEMQDNCINPREAGLKWGNHPLGYWPGKPASELPPSAKPVR